MSFSLELMEENSGVRERYDLSMERIRDMLTEETVGEPYREYFKDTASFICLVDEFFHQMEQGRLEEAPLAVWQDYNHRFYQDILPENYERSFANPAYGAECMGEELGPLLAYLYKEIRGDIAFVHEGRLTDITILNEVFIEIYNLFEEEIPQAEAVKEVLYWFVSDYSDYTVDYRVREGLDPSLSFAAHIIEASDLSDLSYLYRFGEYVSETELSVARFLNSLPEETVRLMARTYTEGYRKGFTVMGCDLSKKSTVQIRYELGFERMVRYAMENFREMSLSPVICRAAVWTVNMNGGRKVGYHGTSPNRQYDYDHRYDDAIFLNKAFKERKTAVLCTAYEKYRKEAAAYAGPAVIETFGQDGFTPKNKSQAFSLSPKQEKLSAQLSNESARIANEYVPGDETSFTIIAFPVPAIGGRFEEIFRETIVINTLDYEKYKAIQQSIIDVLDEAQQVIVTGRGDNSTKLTVSLYELKDRDKETNFENCVADVNIPLGEVFTSPRLNGTNGTLFAGLIYIGDYQFKNLCLSFQDGFVTDYSCDNFDNPEEGRALIKQVILKNHDTLPMGEFAIGTNTTAYAMAQKYAIQDKLPILIAEKTGPHFAVGDTCYSWSEDHAVYNPNGKEVVARDNEVSILRKEDVSKAYYSCHTDITIPYKELGDIVAVTADGKRTAIIENGRFVLPGAAELNKALERIS